MDYPTLNIVDGPDQEALDLAYVSRNIGGTATFTVLVESTRTRLEISIGIGSFNFKQYGKPKYSIRGQAINLTDRGKSLLPKFSAIFIEYEPTTNQGAMKFSNASPVELIAEESQESLA